VAYIDVNIDLHLVVWLVIMTGLTRYKYIKFRAKLQTSEHGSSSMHDIHTSEKVVL
jgi:hypothetical protein